MKNVTVYSCSYGDFPPPPEPTQPSSKCQYIYFTDRHGERRKEGSVWHPQLCGVNGTSIRRASRFAKIMPDHFFAADWTIYIDAGLVLKESIQNLIDEVEDCDLGVYAHTRRKFIHEEARRIGEIFPDMKTWALEHSRSMNRYPRTHLAECGLLVRRNTMRVMALNHIWWGLFCLGPERDQLSFPCAAALSGVAIKWFDGEISHCRRTCARKDSEFLAMKEARTMESFQLKVDVAEEGDKK